MKHGNKNRSNTRKILNNSNVHTHARTHARTHTHTQYTPTSTPSHPQTPTPPAPCPHLVILLHLSHAPQLSGQLEGGEDGVLAGQRDVGSAGQPFVGVEPSLGQPQLVELQLVGALLAVAVVVVGLRDRLSSQQQQLHDLELVPLSGQDERRDVGAEGRVLAGGRVEVVRLPEALVLLLVDVLVLGVFEDRLGDLLVARADGLKQRLVDGGQVAAVQQQLHHLHDKAVQSQGVKS